MVRGVETNPNHAVLAISPLALHSIELSGDAEHQVGASVLRQRVKDLEPELPRFSGDCQLGCVPLAVWVVLHHRTDNTFPLGRKKRRYAARCSGPSSSSTSRTKLSGALWRTLKSRSESSSSSLSRSTG